MSGLVRVGQDDFGAGMLRGVAPDVQAGVGLFNATNALFNDDGDVYRRGGDSWFSQSGGGEMTFIWSGYLNNVAKVLVANVVDFFSLNPLAAKPAPLVNLGGSGLTAPVLPAIVKNTVYLPTGEKWNGGAAIQTWVIPASLPAGERHVCASAGRLLVACGNRVAFSVAGSPEVFQTNDYHDLPGGVLVMGMTAIRDTVFVFTNYGLYTISNLAFNLVDSLGNPQQQLQLILPELSLWHESALASWAGAIVAPCMDRVFLIDGVNPPQPISDSISSLYMSYIHSGFRPGGAKAYRNTYFLPILDPLETGDYVAAQLVCRLNRPVRGRQLYYPWSQIEGSAKNFVMADFALVDLRPRMLGACLDGYVHDLSSFFDPKPTDADGSSYIFDVETRDFPTGAGQPNHVRTVTLRYTAQGAGDLLAGLAIGTQSQRYEDLFPFTYDEVDADYADYAELFLGHVPASGLPPSEGDPARYWYALGVQAVKPPGLEPIRWHLSTAKRARFARMRFRTEDPVEQLIIHHADMSVRRASHDR